MSNASPSLLLGQLLVGILVNQWRRWVGLVSSQEAKGRLGNVVLW
ncbi:unnamed protein product [Linum tenue]|uniref:Uncharacterized protein n=1 Tax=Linum tenue TaxID=586396 RepID=A0AAV0RXS8_9ROSI|nr:unnamed protein product [Linum tenue]